MLALLDTPSDELFFEEGPEFEDLPYHVVPLGNIPEQYVPLLEELWVTTCPGVRDYEVFCIAHNPTGAIISQDHARWHKRLVMAKNFITIVAKEE